MPYCFKYFIAVYIEVQYTCSWAS